LPVSTSRVSLPFYKLLSLQSSAELIRYSISAIFLRNGRENTFMGVVHPNGEAGQVFDSFGWLSAVSSRESIVTDKVVLCLESQARFLL
jgi:hypothetical protein